MKWERAIKYHRWVAFYSVALMFAHGACYVAVLVHGNDNPRTQINTPASRGSQHHDAHGTSATFFKQIFAKRVAFPGAHQLSVGCVVEPTEEAPPSKRRKETKFCIPACLSGPGKYFRMM